VRRHTARECLAPVRDQGWLSGRPGNQFAEDEFGGSGFPEDGHREARS
jgi:hypothetical protein